MGINIFLLARKDMNYLRAYKKINNRLNALFFGGYTFLVYVENFDTKVDAKINMVKIIDPFINYYKLFILKTGVELLASKAVSFVRFYPILVKFASNYYAMDVVKNYLDFYLEFLNKNIYGYYKFDEIIKKEKVLAAIAKEMEVSTMGNIYTLVTKWYIANIIPVLLNNYVNKMKLFVYKLHTKQEKLLKK